MNENLKEQKMISNFPFFIWGTLAYALFYVVCLYKNGSGITFPLFTAGTIVYFVLCMRKLDVKVKRYSIFYMICIELLGLSTCLTDSWVIIFLNKCGIFFLIIVFLLHNFYENKHWNFLDHIKAYFLATIVPIIFIGKPFLHFSAYRKNKITNDDTKKNGKILYVILGIVISLPLVAVVLLLLVSADAVFKNVFAKMFEDIDFFTFTGDSILSSILFVVVFFFVYMLLSFLSNFNVNGTKKERVGGEPIIAITVSAILSVIYVLFCGIQVVYLFIGSRANFTLPNGMTYAQYAREGFFQLLFVCIINLILVLAGIYLFRENKILKVFLCIITSCTYIMIASSAMRMLLYIQYKYLTFLRVFVLWALLVIALVMAGVMITIFKKDFNFFKYSTIIVTCLYLVLSFARVDYIVAKINIDNMEKETQYDFFEGIPVYDDSSYLIYNLSLDAAPVILEYDDGSDSDECGTYNQRKKLYKARILNETDNIGIRKINISRLYAYMKIKEKVY